MLAGSRFHRVALTALLSFFSLIAAAQKSEAQLTSKQFIGAIVPKYEEAKYAKIDQAIATLSKGDLAGAHKLLDEAAKADPELPPGGVMMARLLVLSGNQAPAKVALEQAATDKPSDPEAYLIFGDLAINDRRLTDADLLYQEAWRRIGEYKSNPIRLKEMKKAAQAGMASVAEGRKQWKTAEEHLTEWSKLAEDAAVPHHRLGQVQFRLKKTKEAREQFEAARKIDPTFPVVEISLANLYAKDGDKTSATKLIDEGVKKNPNDAATLLAAAQWAIQNDDFKRAKSYAETALKSKKSVDALLISGLIARHLDDNATAEQRFEEAYLQSPANSVAANSLALILVADKDETKRARALDFARNNFQKNPKNPDAAMTYAWVCFKLGRMQDALQSLNAAMSAGSMSAESAYYAANIMEDRGNLDEAKKLIAKAVRTDQPFPEREKAVRMQSRLRQGRSASDSPVSDGSK